MIGLIVDGEGDHAAFSARFGCDVRVLKTDGPRGHSVTAADILRSAKKQIGILRVWGCQKIALVTDFEGRRGSSERFCKQLSTLADGIDYARGVLFFSPNMMIENWFLADIVKLSKEKVYLRTVASQKSYEGKHGKNELKRLFLGTYKYNEVRHAAELFPLVRGGEVARFSPSYRLFQQGTGLD